MNSMLPFMVGLMLETGWFMTNFPYILYISSPLKNGVCACLSIEGGGGQFGNELMKKRNHIKLTRNIQ